MTAAIAAKEACKMAFDGWQRIWKSDIWNTHMYSRRQIFAVRLASPRLRVLQHICENSMSCVRPYPPLIFEVAPEILADPEGFTLEDIKGIIKPLMKEHLQQLEKIEQIFARRHVELAKYMTILDKLLAAPVSEADYVRACKLYPMSMAEYRGAERLAGMLLPQAYEHPVITIHPSDSHGFCYPERIIPNFLAFQWLNEIRHEEERAKDAAMYEGPAEGNGEYANSYNSVSLTDPRHEPVWMRALEEWLDKSRFVRGSGQSVCDFCAGPCGDCPQRWSNDPESCEDVFDCEECSACTNCPCRPDLLSHAGEDVTFEDPYDEAFFSRSSCYSGSVPPPPPPAPDSVAVGYSPQPLSMRDY